VARGRAGGEASLSDARVRRAAARARPEPRRTATQAAAGAVVRDPPIADTEDTIAIDVRRVVEAAVEAAIQELTPAPKPKKRRLSAGRALLIGAGLATAGRVAVGSRGRGLFIGLEQRIADSRSSPDEDEDLDDATEYDEELELEDEADELDAEGIDEDLEAEDDAEEPEEEEDEPAADADEDFDDADLAPEPPRARSRGRG
jgi:RNA polymerase primary sigma factor